MSKPSGDSGRKRALLLAPEAPYPLAGGGAMRTASVLEYLAARYELDLITFREPGAADPRAAVPEGLVKDVRVIDLPYHSRSAWARATRNAARFMRGVPPLVDRFSGFDRQFESALGEREYDLSVIEHFWCAPYVSVLHGRSRRTLLNLHNIESMLLARCAEAAAFPVSTLLSRFASRSLAMERDLLPAFSSLLVSSDDDARIARSIAPGSDVTVYPNALPLFDLPTDTAEDAIVFSGNLEYEPNRSAIQYFHQSIWPKLKQLWPDLRWRILGKNHTRIKSDFRDDPRVEVTGPVDNAIAELARAKVAVAPLLAGSGTRVKIIEAWAAGVAVVATSIGAEGLPAIAGEHLLIGDDPGKFVEAVSKLLASTDVRNRIARAGRNLYEEKLTWPAVWQRLQAAGL